MRWELLFADLEAQMHAASALDMEQRVNELARIEASQLMLSEALRGALNMRLSIVMGNGLAFHGQISKVEPQWVLLNEGDRSVILPLAKIIRIQGLGAQRAKPTSSIHFTLPAALRVLARNRAMVVLDLDGARGGAVRGVLDQVGADYVQLMQLADGVGRDAGNAQGTVVIPLAALVAVASSTDNDFG